jgi:CBS domain-containing protein
MIENVRVSRLVKCGRKVLTIRAEASVGEAAKLMQTGKVGCLVVTNAQGNIAGIVTERDIVRKVVAVGDDPASLSVAAIMTARILAVSPQMDIAKAQQVMAQHNIRHLPVVDGGELVGMISSRDIVAQQLSLAQDVIHMQTRRLDEIENQYPGISRTRTDPSGRIVI